MLGGQLVAWLANWRGELRSGEQQAELIAAAIRTQILDFFDDHEIKLLLASRRSQITTNHKIISIKSLGQLW